MRYNEIADTYPVSDTAYMPPKEIVPAQSRSFRLRHQRRSSAGTASTEKEVVIREIVRSRAASGSKQMKRSFRECHQRRLK